ncbi:MAG: 5-formyltetrahydrofolate cyclo-ligase, partial [Desulfovibrionales bacterium]
KLAPSEIPCRSRRIHAHLRTLPAWRSATEVLLYAPVRNEVDTWPIFDELRSRGIRTLLPRCRECEPGKMEWAEASCREDLAAGAFNIPEPHQDRCPSTRTFSPDLILIPGVAFDRSGFRLGYGGGYYDRFLSGLADQSSLLAGLAFQFQVVAALPRQKWDIPLHVLITEQEIIWTRT